jgi:hypothetical protein
MKKMYRSFLSILLLGISFISGGQELPADLKDMKLKGNVKQLSIVTDNTSRELIIYNKKGLIAEYWVFNPIELLRLRYVATYNNKDQLIDIKQLTNGIDQSLRTEFAFDASGRPIGRTMFTGTNKQIDKFIYSYDALGRMSDSIHFDGYGNVIEKFSREYGVGALGSVMLFRLVPEGQKVVKEFSIDSLGNVTKEILYDNFGNKQVESHYMFDKKGNKLYELSTFQQKEGNVNETRLMKYKYDSLSRLIEYNIHDPANRIHNTEKYTYDDLGRRFEESTMDSSGIIFRRITHEYDSVGNEIGLTRYMPADRVDLKVRWEYVYDTHGNWTQKTQFIQGVPGQTIRREIEYY